MKLFKKVMLLVLAFIMFASSQAMAAPKKNKNYNHKYNAVVAESSENMIAAYSESNVSMRGSSHIDGDMVIFGGTFNANGNPSVSGTAYYADVVEVDIPNHVKHINTEVYDKSSEEYPVFDALAFPEDSSFSGCAYSDGTENLEIAYWVGNAQNKFESGYVLSQNAFIKDLIIPNNLTLYVDAPENTTRIIRVKNLRANGNIILTGKGSLVIYIDDTYNFNNVSIEGDSDKCAVVYNGDLDFQANSHIKGSILATGDVKITSSTTVDGNIYVGKNFDATGGCQITGLIYAPASDTFLGGSGYIEGQLITNTLEISGSSTIKAGAYYPMSADLMEIVTGEDLSVDDTKGEEKEEPKDETVIDEEFPDYIEYTEDDPNGNILHVIQYDVVNQTYQHGTMEVNKTYSVKENDSKKIVTYYVFKEQTFVPDDKKVTKTLKKQIEEIAEKTDAVFESRKDKIVEERFGRVDCNAGNYSLTISPYVIPALSSDNMHKNWLVWGNRKGQVEKVWMSVK